MNNIGHTKLDLLDSALWILNLEQKLRPEAAMFIKEVPNRFEWESFRNLVVSYRVVSYLGNEKLCEWF
jgi:hypothetical protein